MEIQQIPKVPQAEFRYQRSYTKPGVHPYDAVKWEIRDAVITDQKGQVIFEQKNVEVPSFWSQTAANIVASKYFRGRLGTPGRESSVKQLIGRVAEPSRAGARKETTSSTRKKLRRSSQNSHTSSSTRWPPSTALSGSTWESRTDPNAPPVNHTTR